MSLKRIIRQHRAVAYFVLTYTISWLGALLVVAPRLVRGEPPTQLQGILMFPVMLLGPSITSITLTALLDGRTGLRQLVARMVRWRVAGQWWAVALLLPPCVLLTVLLSLRMLVSPTFTPGLFPLGVTFGLLAGYLEEIGWTGFAYPSLHPERHPWAASALLGVLWGCWHLPVIDFLGAASPHGAYWAPYALAFIVAMTAMRMLICWVVAHTNSVLLAQLMHASSTTCLAVFSPHPITPAQEALWYAVYAVVLWLLVAVVVGSRLVTTRRSHPGPSYADAVEIAPPSR
jgi:membrane protease YdiL (CAAX protease family)